MSEARIVVVGGGLAGLTSALACADAGAQVTLLERRTRLGGATWSAPNRKLGIDIDNGQHVFMRCCDRYQALLARLGVEDRVDLQPRLAIPVMRPGGKLDWIRRTALPPPLHLAASLLRFKPLSLSQRVRAGLTARAFAGLDPSDPALDERSLGDWLTERGESDAAIDGFWDLLIRATLNASAREASLALAAKVVKTGFLETAGGADIGWSRVPLQSLHADPAERALALRGAIIQLRSTVEKIESRAGGGVFVWSRGHRFAADAVIVATPHPAAAGLLPPIASPPDRAPLSELASTPILNLHFVFDRRVMDVPLMAGMGSDVQWLFDRTESSGLETGQYITVSLSAAEAHLGQSQAELRAHFLPAMEALLPKLRSARLTGFAVTCERTATFDQRPGSRASRPPPGRVAGSVHVAGAWTDTGWPATMEGAVRSGEAAAQSALADLGFESRSPL